MAMDLNVIIEKLEKEISLVEGHFKDYKKKPDSYDLGLMSGMRHTLNIVKSYIGSDYDK